MLKSGNTTSGLDTNGNITRVHPPTTASHRDQPAEKSEGSKSHLISLLPRQPFLIPLLIQLNCQLGQKKTCHTSTRSCHTSTRSCHTGTRSCHTSTRSCHTSTRLCHTSTRSCHTGTSQGHATLVHGHVTPAQGHVMLT